MVKVNVLVPPTKIGFGANALVKVGAMLTLSVSVAVPLLPREEVKSPVRLTKSPAVEPVTSTLRTQLAPVVTKPPLRLTTPVPDAAVTVPPQVLAVLAGEAIVSPAGRLSVNANVVASTVLAELSMVKVSVLVPPAAIGSGAKLLANVGGGLTVKESVAVPLLPNDDVRSSVRLVWVPAVELVTSTVMVQLADAATVPPLKVTTLVPAAAVRVPPQALALLAGVVTTIAAGRLSVNANAVAATVLAVLSIVKVRVLVAPKMIGSGENTLAKVGGGFTVRVSLAVPLVPSDEVRLLLVLV